MPKYKVGDRVQVKLSAGRIVQATVKAAVESTEGVRLQVSFGNEDGSDIFCGRLLKAQVRRSAKKLGHSICASLRRKVSRVAELCIGQHNPTLRSCYRVGFRWLAFTNIFANACE
jgi:hypothetical protein